MQVNAPIKKMIEVQHHAIVDSVSSSRVSVKRNSQASGSSPGSVVSKYMEAVVTPCINPLFREMIVMISSIRFKPI